MDGEYYKHYTAWMQENEEIMETAFTFIKNVNFAGNMNSGVDYAVGKTLEAVLDKAIRPYVYFREWKERLIKEASVEFKAANIQEKDFIKRISKSWGEVGEAVLTADGFDIKFLEGATASVPLNAANKEREDYYKTSINGNPTNLFRKGEEKSTRWAVHQQK